MILYHPAGRLSAPKLAEAMSMRASRTLTQDEPVVIRWGTAARQRDITIGREINSRAALNGWRSRYQQLVKLAQGEVSVPRFSTDPIGYPMLGRDEGRRGRNTTRGQGISFYPGPYTWPMRHSFYSEYLPKERQFRVHVVGNATRTRELIHRHETENTLGLPEALAQPVWNHSTGFTYRVVRGDRPKGVIPQAKLAIKALGLDFGAVDVIVHEGTPYVTEVNTAPGLSDATLPWYAEKLSSLVNEVSP